MTAGSKFTSCKLLAGNAWELIRVSAEILGGTARSQRGCAGMSTLALPWARFLVLRVRAHYWIRYFYLLSLAPNTNLLRARPDCLAHHVIIYFGCCIFITILVRSTVIARRFQLRGRILCCLICLCITLLVHYISGLQGLLDIFSK